MFEDMFDLGPEELQGPSVLAPGGSTLEATTAFGTCCLRARQRMSVFDMRQQAAQRD